MASQILSGCPSVTDSLVNSRPLLTMSSFRLTPSSKYLVNRIISVPSGTQSHAGGAAQPLLAAMFLSRGLPASGPQESGDRVHDTAGHQSLRAELQRGLGAVGGQQPSVVLV